MAGQVHLGVHGVVIVKAELHEAIAGVERAGQLKGVQAPLVLKQDEVAADVLTGTDYFSKHIAI